MAVKSCDGRLWGVRFEVFVVNNDSRRLRVEAFGKETFCWQSDVCLA